VSTLGAGIVLWVRWRDRPEADWHFSKFEVPDRQSFLGYLLSQHDGVRPDLKIECLNIGDGAAHAVSVTNKGCKVALMVRDSADLRGFRTPVIEPRVLPGQGVGVLIWLEHPIKRPVSLDVHWTRPPTRHHRTGSQGLLLVAPTTEPTVPWWKRLVWWAREPEAFELHPEDPVRQLLDD